ncbi:MAG TPA: TonB-dependent receptor [Saprospiraceae bacterium]|nr:TonB-dependent receptor [Saprospiraceae bacterium]
MKKRRISISILILFVTVFHVHSQDARLVVKAQQKPPADFFMELSLQSGINIIYSDNVIEKLPLITLEMKSVNVEEVLKEVLKGTNVDYKYLGDQIVLYQSSSPILKFSISGIVTDSVSGEPLISAYVYDEQSNKSTFTNEYGYFNLYLVSGEVKLLSGYSGFLQQRRNFNLDKNQIIQLRLSPNSLLPEVIVNEKINPEDGVIPIAERITLADLQSNVQLGGASDLYRASDFIPGVHTGTDGVGGIHVRGGANDQNLILMDGVPVYHPNHLLGIVSVFNYQVLQQASIYKANFPSKFSGRLSSVMDVRTREGNIHQWGFSGNVGISELGFMAEGPLIDDKVGILVAGRFFLPGIFMPDLTEAYKERNGIEGMSDIDYFDFNGKINWKISLRDRIYLSTYRGSDKFSDVTRIQSDQVSGEPPIRIVSDENFDKNLNWANRTGVFRWNHILNDKIFSNLIVSTSSFVLQSIDKSNFHYSFPETSLSPLVGFDTKEFKSGIKDITTKLELDIRPSNDHKMNAGIYAINYLFQPKSISHNEESQVGDFFLEEGLLQDTLFEGFKVKSLEAGIYGEDIWEIKDGFQLSAGLHISAFFVQGIYYLDPQLRMNFEYQPSSQFAMNIGYSRMTQYLHNLTSSSIGLPTDLWVPTTSKVSPALSDQYSFSAFWKPDENFTVDLSAYTKDMRHLISYQEGASFLLPEGPLAASIVDAGNWETKITEGDGHASGVELQMIYDYEKLQFKLNGTWSRSFRRFDEINNGDPFPDRYDRRWSSTFTGQLKINSKWSAGLNFIYGTGIAITLAESKFVNPGFLFPVLGINYSARNAFRLPPYHRLDITLNYQLAEKETFRHSLSLNLYNVYNRTNPFYITLVQDPQNQVFEYKQFSLFKFFPSLTYRFSFQ